MCSKDSNILGPRWISLGDQALDPKCSNSVAVNEHMMCKFSCEKHNLDRFLLSYGNGASHFRLGDKTTNVYSFRGSLQLSKTV